MLKMQRVAVIILMLVSHISIAMEYSSGFIARNPGNCVYQHSTFWSQYSKVIDLYADLYRVPSLIAYQLIQIENIENLPNEGDCPNAKLKSSTAIDLGLDITDPVQHIEGSIKYLSINYTKFGDWSQSLAGYHAGSNNKAVITKNWDSLPEETKKFVYSFGDMSLLSYNSPVFAISQPPNEWKFLQQELPLIVMGILSYLFLSTVFVKFYAWVVVYVPFLPKISSKVWWSLFIGVPIYFIVVYLILPQ